MEFPGDLVVRTWGFHHCGQGSIPGLRIEITHQAAAHSGKKKKKEKRKKKKARKRRLEQAFLLQQTNYNH